MTERANLGVSGARTDMKNSGMVRNFWVVSRDAADPLFPEYAGRAEDGTYFWTQDHGLASIFPTQEDARWYKVTFMGALTGGDPATDPGTEVNKKWRS